jgi:hypothetical protein
MEPLTMTSVNIQDTKKSKKLKVKILCAFVVNLQIIRKKPLQREGETRIIAGLKIWYARLRLTAMPWRAILKGDRWVRYYRR